MFDAINTFEREFEPYRVRLRHTGGSRGSRGRAGGPRRARGHQPRRATAIYDAALAQPYRDQSVGLRPARAPPSARRVASEILAWRQNDGWVVSPFPPYSEPLAARDAGRRRRRPTPTAAFTHLQNAAPLALLTPDAIPAAAAAVADQPALRHRPERGETDWEIEQHDPHARADRDRTAVGRHRRDRHGHGDQLSRRSGTTSPATWRASAGCRSSKPRGCSCS